MKKELTPPEALYKAAALCSLGEKCSNDISQKVISWGVAATEIPAILKYLTQEGFIDDARFARAFVKDKFTFDKWGRIKITYALRQKQIPQPVIDAALSCIDEDNYRAVALSLIKTKSKTIKGNQRDVYGKYYRFLASRGFESNVISTVLKSNEPNEFE